MPKSLYYFEKILVTLKHLRDCLEIAKVVLEKEILWMKVVIPSGVTERPIQEITSSLIIILIQCMNIAKFVTKICSKDYLR